MARPPKKQQLFTRPKNTKRENTRNLGFGRHGQSRRRH